MLCVQEIKTGTISRVPDELADKRVLSGQYKFIPKNLWKKDVRTPKNDKQ